MQQTRLKPNKLAFIPTELNYIATTNTRINRLRKQGNTSRLLILFLILWNVVLTLQFIPQQTNIPQFTDAQNKQIMIEEEIPTFELEEIGGI